MEAKNNHAVLIPVFILTIYDNYQLDNYFYLINFTFAASARSWPQQCLKGLEKSYYTADKFICLPHVFLIDITYLSFTGETIYVLSLLMT